MRTPKALRSLDDRFLGNRLRGRRDAARAEPDGAAPHPADAADRTRVVETRSGGTPPSTGDGARRALGIVYRVSRLVFLALAAAVALGIVFVLAPTNPDNDVVRLVSDLAEGAAGPFIDVFTVDDDPDRERVVNYGFAAVVYLLLGTLVTRLPGGRTS